jgi:hypothetical protein
MLTIIAEPQHLEFWNELTNAFEVLDIKGAELKMEHSLISLSKWESKWKKSLLYFLEKRELTMDELDDYYMCMLLKPISDPNIIKYLPLDKKQEILKYISDPMSAYTPPKLPTQEGAPRRKKSQVTTSEDIYYWLVEFGIDFSVEKWHLNRVIALVQKCQDKQTVPKKMKKHDILASNYLENARRLKKYNTTG